MRTAKKLFLLITGLAFAMASCVDREDDQASTPSPSDSPNDQGVVLIQVKHKAGDKDFALGQAYTTAAGDEIEIQVFNYYLSNIRLRNRSALDVRFYAEPYSYHLFKASGTQNDFELVLHEVDTGSYSELDFAIGVDQGANYSIDKTGDLNPNDGMAWDWNTGYKFFAIEGKYKDSTGSMKGFLWHIGNNQNYQRHVIEFEKDKPFKVLPGDTSYIELEVDFLDFFAQPNVVKLDTAENVMFGHPAPVIAENYSQGSFKLGSYTP